MRHTGDFKPSEVELTMPPLTACFGKTEAECAAAMLVWYMSKTSDTWCSVVSQQMGTLMKEALSQDPIPEPVRSWNRNPFFQPDFHRLIRDGYVIKSDTDQSLGFTPSGRERLRSWVRP